MGMVVPTHRERLCQALGTVVTPRWHSCAKGVARARHQRPSLPSYIGGFSSTIIAIGRTHFIKGQQVPSCAYFPEDQVHIQEGCLKTMKQPCTISMISVYKRPISFFFFFYSINLFFSIKTQICLSFIDNFIKTNENTSRYITRFSSAAIKEIRIL